MGQGDETTVDGGIPGSLYGRVNVKEMGSRAYKETLPVRKEVKKPSSTTSFADEFVGLKYCPKTKETRQAFDFLASLVHRLMGADQPHDVTLSAADEVLEILKIEDIRELDQKIRIESILGSIDNDQFNQLVNLGRRITDYISQKDKEVAEEDGDNGEVAVVFEEDDEEDMEEVVGEIEIDEVLPIVKEDFLPPLEEEFYTEHSNLMEIDQSTSIGEEATVDLESLAFPQGGHTMTNKRCVVPERSTKVTKAGYEEITIPAPATRPLEPGECLVPVSKLPNWAQDAFSGYQTLNRIQSRVFSKAFGTDGNLLMCAPTGAGKTNVALLTMLREIGKYILQDGSIDLDAFKIVYVAPMKALVQEMVSSFSRRLSSYGIKVSELTGDAQLSKAQLSETQIIVTTPEKWDVISRKGGDTAYTRLVKLVIIDEIHLLHDDRGPVLEALVARLLRRSEEAQEWTRLVGLSATLPNYGDVARFLRCEKGSVFFFDSSFRPCPLVQQFVGITEKNALKRQQLMNDVVYDKVAERSGKVQTIIFVHSRKDTGKTAKFIREKAIETGLVTKFSGTAMIDEDIKNDDLRGLLEYGIGIHHAGLHRSDRNLVERLFAEGRLQVLISTATLAWGVNLPAHTVIIKGTQVYNPEKGKWSELSAQDTLQMLGRAGRPQYDTQGEGIVITQHGELQFYLSLMNTQLPIESQLIGHLLDHINAETVLGSIRSFNEALEWIGYTYLSIRMSRDPSSYGISTDAKERRRELVHAALLALDKAGLIRFERRTGIVMPTELGRIASHYYVSHASMSVYSQNLRPHMDEIELFRIFSLSSEFRLIPVRNEEKSELLRLVERVPIPVKEQPDEPVAKINILLQSYISQLKLEGYALAADMVYVTQSAGRILRALFELCLRRGWSRLAKKALTLCKMVEQRQWLSMSPLRQLKTGELSSDLLRKLEHKDFPFERLFDLNPQELGELIRIPKVGRTLHEQLKLFPRIELEAQIVPLSRELLRIDLAITPQFQWDHSVHGRAETFHLIIEDVDEEHVLHVEPFILRSKWSNEVHYVSVVVPLLDPLPPAYFCSIISDRWLASEARAPIMLRNLPLPEKPSPITEIDPTEESSGLSMIVSCIPGMSEVYADERSLSIIEAQSVPAIFKSDENVLLASPIQSLTSVELAIIRSLASNPSGKCVYMSIRELNSVKARWGEIFASLLPTGKEVTLLTGDSAHDLKLLDKGSIILTNPSNWDLISRRWKNRKNILAAALFVASDIHFLGTGELGATIEVCLSRMRFISAYLESSQNRKIRIIAQSGSPLLNAKDVSAWLGVPLAAMFNFDNDSRPTRISIQVQGFPQVHHESSILAMTKPAFNALLSTKGIVFCEDRIQAENIANSFIGYITAESLRKNSSECIWPSSVEIDFCKNSIMKEGLSHGIGIICDGSDYNKSIIELYEMAKLQVLIVAKQSLHHFNVRAPIVVILGTQSFNGREHRYTDYPIADIHSMLSFADSCTTNCTALILCPSSKKNFIKNILSSPLPIESHLDTFLADHFNAETVVGTIGTKQDAIDYLTWTFLYRRLAQNPAYYGLSQRSAIHICEHLSSIIEQTADDLATAKCIEIESDGFTLTPLNLGIIAAYYNINHLTIEMFAMSLTSTTKLRGILEIVAASNEFDSLPVRHGEYIDLQKIYEKCPAKQSNDPKWNDPHVKALILLQAHFSRLSLPFDLEADQRSILPKALILVQAIVDVIASHAWLGPALAAMEFSQMLVQAQWDFDSPLRQLPHLTRSLLKTAESLSIESIFDIIDDNEKREQLLSGLPKPHVSSIASTVNSYPNVELDFKISPEECEPDAPVSLVAHLKRDNPGIKVPCPFFPSSKDEAWWLVIGNPAEKSLLAIKRVLPKAGSPDIPVSIDFTAPPVVGSCSLKVYLISDCWIGCDQEFDAPLNIIS